MDNDEIETNNDNESIMTNSSTNRLPDVVDAPGGTPGNSRRNRHGSGNNRLSESVSEIVQRFLGSASHGSHYSLNALHRESPERSSTSSFDALQLTALQEEAYWNEVPNSDSEMRRFIEEMSGRHKKRSQLQQALDLSWVKVYAVTTHVGVDQDTILHTATRMGNKHFVNALVHCKPSKIDIDARNDKNDCALHIAALKKDLPLLETLLKHGASVDLCNNMGLTALQIAALNNFVEGITVLLNKGADYLRTCPVGGSLLTLACLGIHNPQLKEADRMHEEVEEDSLQRDRSELLNRTLSRSRDTAGRDYPILDHLLNLFERHPRMALTGTNIGTTAGTPLHYFALLNFVTGVDRLLRPPFSVPVDLANSNGLTALSIAAWKGFWSVGEVLLNHGANPNPRTGTEATSPLHSVIDTYHVSRVDSTVKFVDKLIEAGADAQKRNSAGETPAHLAVKTADFRIISKFINFLGEECLSLADESGNTLFHYAVATLDEECIRRMIEMGANLMAPNRLQASGPVTEEDVQDHENAEVVVVRRLPVQEAMKNGNSEHFFNALARSDLRRVVDKLDRGEETTRFVAMHLVAAAKEVRSDIVRRLFLLLRDQDVKQLHSILLFSDTKLKDRTYTKTALQWAVENDDRFCTTEILHQEYKCHASSKVRGLCCLRSQIHGDELLSWTVETFSLLYERTWAQRNVLPLMHIIPLFMSFFAFIYDYYSDYELCKEYFFKSDLPALIWNETLFIDSSDIDGYNNSTEIGPCSLYNATHALISLEDVDKLVECNLFSKKMLEGGNKTNEPFTSMSCVDLERTPVEYRTAFLVNLISMFIPLIVFYLMCLRELITHIRQSGHSLLVKILQIFGSIIVSFPGSPLFILYVACKHIVIKFRHRGALKKSRYRRKLQRIEYLWGIARTSEAGLESCMQIILQMWLLSSHFKRLAYDDLGDLVDQTVNGLLFFLSFSIREADEVEKSLGKMAMAMFTLVLGVSSCYRTLKRGAVRIKNTAFIFLSLLLQIVARMGAIALFFFAFRDFQPILYVLLMHFGAVFALKWSFERVRHTKGVLYWLVSIINVLASSLVFVRVMPIERSHYDDDEEGDEDENDNNNVVHKSRTAENNYQRRLGPSSLALEHSTFFIQSLFFALVITENIVLSLTPFFRPLASDRALDCLGESTLLRYCLIIALIHVASWLPHCLYYKYIGHPWADINGPIVDFKPFRCRFHVHLCGKEKVVGMEDDDNMCHNTDSSENQRLVRRQRRRLFPKPYCIDFDPEEDEEYHLDHITNNSGDTNHNGHAVVAV